MNGTNGRKWKMFGIPAATVSAFLGVAVAWGQLDLPRPAWHSEVVELATQVAANSQLILGDKWLRLTAQIKELEAKLRGNPTDHEMIDRLAVLQLQLRAVDGKLK